MIEEVEIQDKIMDELSLYQDGSGTFGKDIAIRQRRNDSLDPGEPIILKSFNHFDI
jgi:hypothetical protein